MSTYYKTSKPIPFKEIQKRDIGIVLDATSDDPTKVIVDYNNNVVQLVTNEQEEVTDILRFGNNYADYIISKLEEEFNIKIYSEHDKEYGNTVYFGAGLVTNITSKDLDETV